MDEKKFVLPETNLKPVNGRIFCKTKDREDIKLSSGIILPSHYKQLRNDDEVKISNPHYMVVAIAEDVSLAITRGDEVIPMTNPDAISWSYPIIIDWGNDGQTYIVLHESEIFAVLKG